jgi:hypothetical protein
VENLNLCEKSSLVAQAEYNNDNLGMITDVSVKLYLCSELDFMSARKAFALGAPCAVAEEAWEESNTDEACPAGACLLGNHNTSLAVGAVTIIIVVVDDDLGLLLLLLHHHWLGSHHHRLGYHDWLGHHHRLGLHVHLRV